MLLHSIVRLLLRTSGLLCHDARRTSLQLILEQKAYGLSAWFEIWLPCRVALLQSGICYSSWSRDCQLSQQIFGCSLRSLQLAVPLGDHAVGAHGQLISATSNKGHRLSRAPESDLHEKRYETIYGTSLHLATLVLSGLECLDCRSEINTHSAMFDHYPQNPATCVTMKCKH